MARDWEQVTGQPTSGGDPNFPRGSGGCCAGDPAFRLRAAAAPALMRWPQAARTSECRHPGRSPNGTT
jgi:hypothetical protein